MKLPLSLKADKIVFSFRSWDIAEMTRLQLASVCHKKCHQSQKGSIFLKKPLVHSTSTNPLYCVKCHVPFGLCVCLIKEYYVSFPQGFGQTRFISLWLGGRYLVATKKSKALISQRDGKFNFIPSCYCHKLLAFHYGKLYWL